METFYYNLSGGINQNSTKTELGLNTKNIYWSDSKNVQIHLSKGIIRQKGNTFLVQVPENEPITGLHEMKFGERVKLLITTDSGKMYIYSGSGDELTLLDKELQSKTPVFANFLDGTIVSSSQDKMFFIKNNSDNEIEDCNLKNPLNETIYSNVIAIYKGRVWAASNSTIYFSALGTYNDFQTEDDAGYISDFHTDTDEITALKAYKDYLAIYKKNKVYLLTGSSPSDFAITPFADKGACSSRSVINVNNNQYFFSTGVYSLEVGEMNQIVLGSEITNNIKPEFKNFDSINSKKLIALNLESENQAWYFIPYKNDDYFHTIWINDYLSKAWYKRVLPQNITFATLFNGNILTADSEGKIYQELIDSSFDGEPIEFMWKSPFLSLGNPTIRKTIDEFYFLLDETYENNFKFSVYKNFDSENQDDKEEIYSTNYENLIWHKENSQYSLNDTWSDDDNDAIWAIDAESMYKAEISEANYAVQLCVEGNSLENNAAIIGIEFKEIYNED